MYSLPPDNSKCHTGRTCIYDPVGEDKWSIDIRKHRLLDTIEGVLKPKEVPACQVENDCQDCTQWTFKETKKPDDDEVSV